MTPCLRLVLEIAAGPESLQGATGIVNAGRFETVKLVPPEAAHTS